MEDVTVVTMSEFGRTACENGNQGTDHGHASVMFVMGRGVRGGEVYGRWPGLADHQLNEGCDLALTTDFRDVLGEVVSRGLVMRISPRCFRVIPLVSSSGWWPESYTGSVRYGSRITALLCLSMCAVALAAQPAARPQGSLIAGTVIDQSSGAPLPRATVRLTLVSGSTNSYAIDISDSSGRFGFSYLPPGHYRLRAGKDSYDGGTYGGRKPGDPGVILVIGQNDRRWNVVLRMARTGVISGTIRDESGDPLRGVQISVFRRVWRRGKQQLQVIREAGTDDRGQYRVAQLLPDQYIVEARPDAGAGRVSMHPGRMSEQTEPMMAPAFYPGNSRAGDAAPVQVEAGREVSGIDLRVIEQKPASLKAAISVPAGFTGQVLVRVLEQDKDTRGRVSTQGVTVIPGSGTVDFGNLMPGAYRLVATAEFGGKPYRGATDVDVGAGSQTEAAISLAGGVDLHGAVKLEGGGETPKNFEVTLTPGDDIPAQVNPRATTGADSSFTIKDVPPGIWDINVKPIVEGGYIKSMMLGDQDVLTEDMAIGPGTSAPLNIVISSRGATIEGDVDVQGRGGPQQAIVLLAPVGKFNGVLSFYRTRIVDETGHYVVRGILPGSYRVYAFDEMAQQAYQDQEFLKPFENEGEALTLEEGQTVKVNPKLLQTGSQP